jgi:rod shape determining protein RodA
MILKQGLKKIDWSIILTSFILTFIGITSVFVNNSFLNINHFNLNRPSLYRNQAIYLLICIIIVFFISKINISILINYSFFIYVFGILLLLFTLLFGMTINNAKSWINIGGFTSFQPSEFMKIFFILYLSYFLGRKSIIKMKDIILSFFIFLIPFVLIILQPDLGTAIVYFFIWLITILSCNTKIINKLSIIFLIFISILILILSMYTKILPVYDYQIERLRVYPDHLFLTGINHYSVGYQVDQSLIAIGSSSLTGKGLGQGTQTQLGFLPEISNDFIFSSLVEELGVLISFIIITLYIFLIWRIYIISTLNISSSRYLLVIGIISIISIHVIQNIGMNIGLIPVTGIPLPFISLGGSFLISLFVSIGLLTSIIINKN